MPAGKLVDLFRQMAAVEGFRLGGGNLFQGAGMVLGAPYFTARGALTAGGEGFKPGLEFRATGGLGVDGERPFP